MPRALSPSPFQHRVPHGAQDSGRVQGACLPRGGVDAASPSGGPDTLISEADGRPRRARTSEGTSSEAGPRGLTSLVTGPAFSGLTLCTPGDKDILLSLTLRRGLVRKLTGWGPRAGSVALGAGGGQNGLALLSPVTTATTGCDLCGHTLLLTEEQGWMPDLGWAATEVFWETETDPDRAPQLWEAELKSHVTRRPERARASRAERMRM